MIDTRTPLPTDREELVEAFANSVGDGKFVPVEIYDAQTRADGEIMLVLNTYASKTLHYVTYVGKLNAWREIVPSSFRVPDLALNELFKVAAEKGVEFLRDSTRLVGVRNDVKEVKV